MLEYKRIIVGLHRVCRWKEVKIWETDGRWKTVEQKTVV